MRLSTIACDGPDCRHRLETEVATHRGCPDFDMADMALGRDLKRYGWISAGDAHYCRPECQLAAAESSSDADSPWGRYEAARAKAHRELERQTT